MSLVLGIDTGGTYTDGVILDRASKKILAKAKSLTTRDDLSRGITDCINRMEFDDFTEIFRLAGLALDMLESGETCRSGRVHPVLVICIRMRGNDTVRGK